jgi:hypothetical protein
LGQLAARIDFDLPESDEIARFHSAASIAPKPDCICMNAMLAGQLGCRCSLIELLQIPTICASVKRFCFT